MRVMSDALRKVAGDRLRQILRALTRNTMTGVLVGAGVTCLIQSSSATTVMVVGFVNAGLMSLTQAIGVILGANIGTTITAWMVSGIGVLKITNYALPAIGVGLVVNLAAKRQWRHWGSVVLGFGLLFFGLYLMRAAMDPIGQSDGARHLMSRLAGSPVAGILIGTAMTMVIQSSSATIAVAQLMAYKGVLPLGHAIHLILGDNIGTTITAQLASIGTNVEARRAARVHMMFKIVGVVLLWPFVQGGHYARFIEWLIPGELAQSNVMIHVAASHTVFNVIAMLVFVPLASPLARLVTKLLPGEPGEVAVEPRYLEEHLLNTPSIALEQARREVVRMIELAASTVRDAGSAFFEDDSRLLMRVAQKEQAIDNLQDQITKYLIMISRRDLEPSESNELPVLLHSVNDIERIGDHATNLAEAAQTKIDGRLPFTDSALEELVQLRDEVHRMFDLVVLALAQSDMNAARSAVRCEDRLNAMEKAFRQSHLRRLSEGECDFNSGLVFVDCVCNYEKVGDHLVNAAQAVLGDFQWGEKVRSVPAAHQGAVADELPELEPAG
jgi:phosphate:Na+ symporter